MRCVIFDLDGTLADTSGDLIAAANHTLAELGVDACLTYGPDDATALRGGRAMLTLGCARAGVDGAMSGAIIERGYPILLQAYGRAIDVHTRLYPGAVQAVERLRARGIAVGVCTNKPHALAQILLTNLGVRDMFASLIGADSLPTRKPDPAPLLAAIDKAGGDRARSVLIGDTVTDRDTSRAAGVGSVLVSFGPLGQGVTQLQPDAVLHHYDDLDDVVDQILA
jgi:phosphoglycolate phosphatase